ncbi:hypothetical protein BOX15_Mlig025232g2 [Macrostomum lignano]|uniref:MD-2-related lipid-recognition domain-containing protein n=1 Tax=Macrostomum lignano TaxID=282301 RepID=A0A267EQ39_9PLAT|nr:hypothetical protein BOX15_Mlig025232g1 [Macrostomum lignano]PAA78281.1 hypothetical protein BOX15_Mlig025232g2 [Macrostomum lignano]
MKLTLLFAALACAFAAVLADPVKFKDCGSKVGKINSVDINPCPKLPCELKRGTKVGVTVDFTSSESATAVKSVVHGVISGIAVPFPLPDPNACNAMSPKCPLSNGASYKYTNALEVQQAYPTLALVVRWELTDSNNNDLVCFEVPARVV